MIDDIKETQELIRRMIEELPLFAYPSDSLRDLLINIKNIKIKSTSLLKIENIIYLYDQGGIGCNVSLYGTTELILVSLTHLRMRKGQPLVKEIEQYQSNRRRALWEEERKSKKNMH